MKKDSVTISLDSLNILKHHGQSANTAEENTFIAYLILIVVAGIIGGLINFLNHDKTDQTVANFWKSSLYSLSAACIIPLFLNTMGIKGLITDPLTFSYTNILLFMGYCFLAAIVSRSFVESMAKKALNTADQAKQTSIEAEAKAKDASEKAKFAEMELEKAKAEIVQQEKLGAFLLKNTRLIIDGDSDEELVDLTAYKNDLQKASPLVKSEIFEKAREYRRHNWKNKPNDIHKLIPIFESLIESIDGNDLHRYYAQLGYTLKDSTEKQDLEKSIMCFNKAIEYRKSPKRIRIYEFNRAIARILLEENKSSRKSSVEMKNLIVDDLKAAAGNAKWNELILNYEEEIFMRPLMRWCNANRVNLKSIVTQTQIQ